MNPDIFREYDIRGLVDADLDRETVRAIGRGYGSAIAEGGGSVVAVGMDVRLSSPALAAALIDGITAAGVDVRALGVVPTPAVYFAVHQDELDGAVQVTGSHNPVEFNGFKMMKGTASFYGQDIQALRARLEKGDFRSGRGRVVERDIRAEYLAAMQERLRLDRPLKVVLDAGNGCAGALAPELFRRLGAQVEELYCEPDGRFPNHMPDPTLPGTLVALRERVLASGADIGLAYDGDADRLGALDEQGRILWGDQLLALFARQVLARRPGSPILFEVKCSRALIEDIEAHGGRPVMVPTGHSIIKSRMKETGSPLAGEMSGHMFFADDWYGFDDAIYASGRLAQLVASSPRPLSALAGELPRYHATPEIRVDCPDSLKFGVVDSVRDRYRATHEVIDVDGARVNFPDGWGLVRASNTQPVLVLRAEGTTPQARDAIEADLRARLLELGVGAAASG